MLATANSLIPGFGIGAGGKTSRRHHDGDLADQLGPTHLILDLESVRFLGSSGLGGLLHARELAQAAGSHLHLAGLITRVAARAVQITGLLGLVSAYPTLLHAVIDWLARHSTPCQSPSCRRRCGRLGGLHTAPAGRWNYGWWDRDTGLGPLADSISCRVPVTHSVTDTMAAELLAARGLWLFADSSGGPLAGSRHGVGAVSDDAQLIALAHRVHDDARHPGLGAPDNVGCLDDGLVFHADRDRMDPGRMSVPPMISHLR